MLEIKNLTVMYGNVRALDSLSLQVGEGEIVAVMGSNGAGKSTLLKTISGLVTPRAGSILFEGRETISASASTIVRSGIIHVPEGRKIFPEMTVRENFLIGAYAVNKKNNEKEMRMNELLAMFPELKDRKGQPGNQLSGGEQQMLAVARGLMAHPRLLMLDEPSMGLAPVVVERIGEIIKTLRSNGVAILLAEQNIYFSLDIADRAYVLETGRVVIEGPSSTVALDPQVQSAYLGTGHTSPISSSSESL
jgi:branched-chain amino acid transport system ATP-binding protein